MKKIFSIIFVMLLLCSCGSKNESSSSFDKSDMSFVYNDNKIDLDSDINDILPLLNDLGDYDFSESDSCYYDGKDRIYTFDGLSINTYPNPDGHERINTINILNGNFSTLKNITVGSSLEDVVNAYGDGYEEVGIAKRYSVNDNLYLDIFVINDKVDSISYTLIP